MADDQDQSQKTEEPTPKRLDDARKKGDVANSREVANFFMLFAGLLMVGLMVPGVAGDILRVLERFFEQPHLMSLDDDGLRGLAISTLSQIGLALGLPVLAFAVAAFASSFVQHGLLFAPEKIKPSLSKISLIQGTKKLFSLRSVAELIKGLLKMAMVAAVAWVVIVGSVGDLLVLPALPLKASLGVLHGIAAQVMGGVVAVLAFVALADFLYQKHEHVKKLRMTMQEVRDEHKQLEGDPHVKARLRQIRTERARQRMIQAVPEADVVITNPTHYAVALKYEPTKMRAPILIAKGIDQVAQRIRAVADEHEIPIVENPPLARALHAGVELEESIPPEHYKAVAEIISFVMKMKRRVMPKNAL